MTGVDRSAETYSVLEDGIEDEPTSTWQPAEEVTILRDVPLPPAQALNTERREAPE